MVDNPEWKANPMKLQLTTTMAALAALALAGCGGGGSGMAMIEVPPPGEAATGLYRDTAAPHYALTKDDTIDSLLASPEPVTFPVLAASVHRIFGDTDTAAPDETGTRVMRLRTAEGALDGTAVLHLNGEEVSIEFAAADRVDSPFDISLWQKPDISFWLVHRDYLDEDSFYDGPFLEYLQTGAASFANDAGEWFYSPFVFGVQTPAGADLDGTASYRGGMSARAYDIDNPSGRHSLLYRGIVALEADFDDMTMSGAIDSIEVQMRDANNDRLPYVAMPASNSFAIAVDAIRAGGFAGTVTGVDTAATSPGDLDAGTVAGYEAHLIGNFYGPSAEEAGAVFSGASEAHGRTLTGFIVSGTGAGGGMAEPVPPAQPAPGG